MESKWNRIQTKINSKIKQNPKKWSKIIHFKFQFNNKRKWGQNLEWNKIESIKNKM